jgi:hypothetical protein
MMKSIHGKISDRRLRLFVCACVRLAWDNLTPASQDAVEVGERFADQAAKRAELNRASRSASQEADQRAAEAEATMDPEQGAYDPDEDAAVRANAAEAARLTLTPRLDLETIQGVMRTIYWAVIQDVNGPGGDPDDWQCMLLREIIGNPFRPASLNVVRQSATVVGLARAAYEQRASPAGTLDPDRLAVLADALEDAGCTETPILEHLRGSGPHYRGCWAVDLLLEKE